MQTTKISEQEPITLNAEGVTFFHMNSNTQSASWKVATPEEEARRKQLADFWKKSEDFLKRVETQNE